MCEKFDVFVNRKDGSFTEENCEDEECEYCKARPKLISLKVCNNCRFLHNEECGGVDFDED